MDREQIKHETLQLVIRINECIEANKVLSAHVARGVGGRETALSTTKLQEAQHWLAEALTELDTEA